MRLAARTCVLFVLAIVCIGSTRVVFGQGSSNNTGNGGIHSIRGRIYLPNGRALENSIKVELQSSTQPTASVYTDSNGAFAFMGLNPGSYTIVVNAGELFEIAREYFLIDQEVQIGAVRVTSIPKNLSSPIYLQAKRSVSLKNEILNAKSAGVPKAALQRFEHALTLSQNGKNDEALKEFSEALTIYPSFALPHIEIGKIYIRLGKLNDAVDALRSAIKIDPSDFDARLNCGIALLNLRELDNALSELNQAAALNQTAVTPHFYLGIVFVQKHALDDAQKEMELAKQLAGTNDFPLIHKYLGGIYWQKGSALSKDTERRDLYKLAVDELEKYIKLLPAANDAAKIRETITQLRSKMG